MSETQEQEISAIEAGFKQAIIAAFLLYHGDISGNPSNWADDAMMRFRRRVISARAARAAALKVIEEVIK